MINMKLTILFIILIAVSACSEFALLASGSSVVLSQNAYSKVYSGTDLLTIMSTDKDIKRHIYDTIKTNRSTKTSD